MMTKEEGMLAKGDYSHPITNCKNHIQKFLGKLSKTFWDQYEFGALRIQPKNPVTLGGGPKCPCISSAGTGDIRV